MISQNNKEALKNPWVLGIATVLLISMSGTFFLVYIAFKNPPNLVVEDFYERGKRYEDTQKRIEQEKALGWTGLLMIPTETRVNQTQMYEVFIQGKNSVGLDLDSVTISAYRPSDAKADFSVDMTLKSPGVYAADMSFHLPGIWDLIVVAKQGDQEFLVTKRVSIFP